MTQTFPTKKISDVCSMIVDCVNKTAPKVEGPTPWKMLRTPNIRNGRIDTGNCFYVDQDTFTKWTRRATLEPGDTILTREAPVGEVGLVREAEGYFLGQRLMQYRANPQVMTGDFLHYAMRSPFLAHQFHAHGGTGSVVDHLRVPDCKEFLVPCPTLEIQKPIAAILRALDDKIELNRRMSATLEEIARALYRSWFVDFDPVHARALGQPPAHMDPATAALFPNSFGPDGLPKGWEISSVNDIFDVVMGQSPPGNTYNDDGDGLPFFQGRTDFGFRYPENRKFCSAPSRIAEPESVLLSVRAPVGDLNRAWERCCIGRGVASLSEKAGRMSFGYYAMWSLSAELLSYDSEGTVFGAINKKQLLGLSSLAVPETLRDCFEEVAAPIDSHIRNLTDESRTLAALRDTLLPRLMSGELRIREAEEHVAEVV